MITQTHRVKSNLSRDGYKFQTPTIDTVELAKEKEPNKKEWIFSRAVCMAVEIISLHADNYWLTLECETGFPIQQYQKMKSCQ